MFTLLLPAIALGGDSPADAIPTPVAERCIPFLPDLSSDDEVATPTGLGYPEVRAALGAVIQHALGCARPEGMSEVHLTFELTVGCDGLVSKVVTVEAGGAPEPYVACVAAVIGKADFPAHDQEDGQLVTYPVDVSW